MARDAGQLVEVASERLLSRVRFARSEVLIAAPFISHEMAKAVANAAIASGARKLQLLTALTARSVSSGALDPSALRTLIDHGFEVCSIQNLHAKVSIVDASWGLVGSGNLTAAGLVTHGNGNVELGVVLEARQVKEARSTFRRWWRKATSIDIADLSAYERLFRVSAARTPSRPTHGPILPVDVGPSLSAVRRRDRTGLWLKTLYHDTRRERDAWWRKVRWISDGRPPRDPTNPSGGPAYVVGDLLVLYLVERDGPLRCCPAIAEVVGEPRHDPAFVREHATATDAERWPWVTDVKVRHHTSLARAPKLADLGVRSESVRRQGRIVLDEAQFLAARERIARRRRVAAG